MKGFPALLGLERLCLTAWIGGGLFFALFVAPNAFHVLADTHQAGLLVGACLRALHQLGLWCGAVLLVIYGISLFRYFSRTVWLRIAAAVLMTALTAYSQWSILPQMERLRSADSVQTESFRTLHAMSVWVEGGVLLLGLALVLMPSTALQRPERER